MIFSGFGFGSSATAPAWDANRAVASTKLPANLRVMRMVLSAFGQDAYLSIFE
jgi:hypothetical protein